MRWEAIEGGKISEDGDVMADKLTVQGRKMFNVLVKPSTDKRGFLVAWLHTGKNKRLRVFHVHREVARLFVDNPNQHSFVEFKDGNKSNISSSNLQWVRCNERDETNTKITKADAELIRQEWPHIQERGGTMTDLAGLYDVTPSYISHILKGRRR